MSKKRHYQTCNYSVNHVSETVIITKHHRDPIKADFGEDVTVASKYLQVLKDTMETFWREDILMSLHGSSKCIKSHL